MGNMDYCRFQNTIQDLKDCYYHFDDDLDPKEKKARDKMVRLCNQIVSDYGDEIELQNDYRPI